MSLILGRYREKSQALIKGLDRGLSIGRLGRDSSGRRRGMWRRSRAGRRAAELLPILATGDRNGSLADTEATSARHRHREFVRWSGARRGARPGRNTLGTWRLACRG